MKTVLSGTVVVPELYSAYVTHVVSIPVPVNCENGIATWGLVVTYIVRAGIEGAVKVTGTQIEVIS